MWGATTLSINGLIATLNINGLFATLSITALYHDAHCRILFIVMLNVVMLSVVAHDLNNVHEDSGDASTAVSRLTCSI
jgi:hypothetical protein